MPNNGKWEKDSDLNRLEYFGIGEELCEKEF
jgi:hypothetical protein